MNTEKKPSTITVSDLYLASALRTLDIPIKSICQGSNGLTHFVFESDVVDLSKLMEEFYLGELRIDPHKFAKEWRALRTMITHREGIK